MVVDADLRAGVRMVLRTRIAVFEAYLPAARFDGLLDQMYEVWGTQLTQGLQSFIATFDSRLYFLFDNPILSMLSPIVIPRA